MKIIEHDVWISKANINNPHNCYMYGEGQLHESEYKTERVKAKLIIEVPEREITITEDTLRGNLHGWGLAEAKINDIVRDVFGEP